MIDQVNHAAEKCLANCRLSASDGTENVTSNGKNLEASNSLSRGDKAKFPKSLCLDSLRSSRAHALCQEFSPDRDIHNNLFPVVILCSLMNAVALTLFTVILPGTNLLPGCLSWPRKVSKFLFGQIRLKFGNQQKSYCKICRQNHSHMQTNGVSFISFGNPTKHPIYNTFYFLAACFKTHFIWQIVEINVIQI